MVSDDICRFCRFHVHPVMHDSHVMLCSRPSSRETELATKAAIAIENRRKSIDERVAETFGGLVGQLVIARSLGDEASITAAKDIERIIEGPPDGDTLLIDCWQNGWSISIKACLQHNNPDPYLATRTRVNAALYVLGRRRAGQISFEVLGWTSGNDLKSLSSDELNHLGMASGYGMKSSLLKSIRELDEILRHPGPGKLC